ncbi:MAG: EcsC family protein, partial [Vampirovibrionia bacterium]
MKRKQQQISKVLSKGIFNSIEKSGEIVGGIFDYISRSKLYSILADKLGINWFFDKILNVDITKVQKQVDKFKNKYPNASKEEIALKLTKHKAIYSGSVGFVSGIIPANIPALIIDFVASTAAQSELIYEIALIYDQDLNDPTRKGEVLTLIALGASSTKTAEASLRMAMEISSKKIGQVVSEKMIKSLSIIVGEKVAKRYIAKLIPVVGGLIGAGLNASIIILTGKGAIAFYKNLTSRPQLYTGELSSELKQIYRKVEEKNDSEDQFRTLIIIKVIIYLMHNSKYNNDTILKAIKNQFNDIYNIEKYSNIIDEEILNPTYSEDLINKMDKSTVSLLIT